MSNDQYAITNDTIIPLRLPAGTVAYLLQVLGERPYKEVDALIRVINQHVDVVVAELKSREAADQPSAG